MMPRSLKTLAVVTACLFGVIGCAELGVESRSPVGLLAPGESPPTPVANTTAAGTPTGAVAAAPASTATPPPATVNAPVATTAPVASSLAARPASAPGPLTLPPTAPGAMPPAAVPPPVAALPPPSPVVAPEPGRERAPSPQPTALLVGQPPAMTPTNAASAVAPRAPVEPLPTTSTQALITPIEPTTPRSLNSAAVSPTLPALVPPAEAQTRPVASGLNPPQAAPGPIVLLDQPPAPVEMPTQPTTRASNEPMNVLMPTEPVRNTNPPATPSPDATRSAAQVEAPVRSVPNVAPTAATQAPSLTATPATSAQPPSRTVARVGDEVVNLRDLTAAVKARVAEMPSSEKLTRRKIIAQARNVLKGMIVRSLVLQEAREQLGPESVDRTILALEQQWNAAELPELIRRERALGTEDLRVKLVRKETTPEAIRDEYVIRSLSTQLIQRTGFSGSFEAYLEALRKKRPVTSVMSSSELAKAGEAEARGEISER